MIEMIVQDHLRASLDVPVWMEHQEHEPERFVLIEKTSGGMKNQIASATIAVQSYAASMHDAAKLNEEAKLKMFCLPEREEVSGVRLISDYNFTDTQSKRYRYQAVFTIFYKEGKNE